MVSENANLLPIDIHCGKLLEWLQSRRHCGKDWRDSAMTIRSKISHAIQDMPEHPTITEMLSGTYITYFHCQKIVDVLRETEASSKNMFGRYSSQRMKDWQEILKIYEKDNVYLSEAAQILQQFVQYEIPAMKKQITKCQTNEQECERKEAEYEKLSREADRIFRQECQKMGIDGKNLKQELFRLSDSLPNRFEKLVEKFKELAQLINYYENFRRLTCGKTDQNQSVRTLRLIQTKGNVTVFEYKNGFPPTEVERKLASALDENENQEEEAAIDFGFEEPVDVLDFGIEEVVSGDAQHDTKEISSDKVARLEDALTLLEYRETLAHLMADLKELDSFLLIRSLELNRQQATDALIMGAASSSDWNMNENLEEIKSYRDKIHELLTELNDNGLKNLRKLRVSPAYVEKLVEVLIEPAKRSKKYIQMSSLMNEQQKETRKQMQEAQKQCDLLAKRAKELQKQIELDISKRYQNRPVNIIGSASAALN